LILFKKIWNKFLRWAFNKKEQKPLVLSKGNKMRIIKPKFIILHHSLTKDGKTVSANAIRKYHTEVMGWDDVGYNSISELVNDEYEILIGRMLNEQGAHCRGHNHNTYGHCIVGNYDIDEVPPEMWMLNLKWVRSLCDVFDIPEENVLGHREFDSSKTCPGEKFNLKGFRLELKVLKTTQ